MDKKYDKANFNIDEFLIEIGFLKGKLSGFKHQNNTLQVFMETPLTPEEQVLLDSFVLNHSGVFKEYILPVSARQIRTALIMSGKPIAAIEEVLSQLPEPNRSIAQVAWEYSNEYFRDNPLLVSLAPLLGFTESQLDDLWHLARTL